MASKNVERLLNVIMTIGSRRRIDRAKLFSVIPDYAEATSEQAAERMFERDKEDLRAMGIPLVTEDIGVFEDEQGYRIDRRDYDLPPVELSADEMAVVGLASRVWAHATMAGTAATAWRKVAAGDEVRLSFAEAPLHLFGEEGRRL